MSSSITPTELTTVESLMIILSIEVEELGETLVGRLIRFSKLLVDRAFMKSWELESSVLRVSMLKSPVRISNFFSLVEIYRRDSRRFKNFGIDELGDL